MADNCPILEPWPSHPVFPDSFWTPDAISPETQTLIRALQLPLSTETEASATVAAIGRPSFRVKHEPTSSGSASDPDMTAGKRLRNRPALRPPACRISKRKPRPPSKPPTTTFISADPANFRRMVQQVTGARFEEPRAVAEAAVKPEPQGAALQGSWLPTLDTSAFFLGRDGAAAPSPGSNGPLVSALGGTGFAGELPLPCFPTLQSWGVM